MPKVKHIALTGHTINVAGALLSLDANGEAEATAEQAEILAQLDGWEVLGAETLAPKTAEAKVEETKTDAPAAEEPKADEPKKSTKKTASKE